MELGIIIKNMVIVSTIMAAVFLSQQPIIKSVAKNAYTGAKEQGVAYIAKNSDWFSANVVSSISGGLANGEEVVTRELTKQKNNLVQNLWENVKKYFAAKFSATFGTKVE